MYWCFTPLRPYIPVAENVLGVGDGRRVPGELEPGGGVGLDLHEVGRRRATDHLLALPGVQRGVDDDQGGGERGAPLVSGDDEEAVELADTEPGHLNPLLGGVHLLNK